MSTKRKWNLSEDWTIVLLGFLIIVTAIAGWAPGLADFSWKTVTDLKQNVFNSANITTMFSLFFYVYLIALVGNALLGNAVKHVLLGFPVIFILTLLAFIIGGNKAVKVLNMETVIFSLMIGLVIRNFFSIPEWLQRSLSSEFFVKIGLVLLGTSIIFSDILKAGSLGLVQSVAVVLAVWYFSYWLCKKLKVDEEMSMMLSSAVSICGVSAAIATSGAIKGDPKKLSLVVSLVLITAVPMMVCMPWIAQKLGLSQEITGAWLGGTIDTTGAVVASGSLVGEAALQISTIVKFSQNVLLGLAAFAISIYWSYSPKTNKPDHIEKPGVKVIWERFPKFVIGFLLASLLFSFVVPSDIVQSVKAPLKNIQGLWFALAFTAIGLETNFRDLIGVKNRKPVLAFMLAQFFNILFTLIIAYLLFR